MPDTSLYYEERGQGTPIVLLHGFPFDHTIWQSQLQDVSGVARVLAVDLPGFGRSEPLGDTQPTMEDYANTLALWAGQVGLDRFVLVGHSMGGYIALAMMRHFPEMISGLGLVCTRASADTPEARESRSKLIKELWDRGPQAVVDSMLKRLFAPQTLEERPDVVARIQEVMMRQPVEGMVQALQAMAGRPDSTPLLPAIKVPTLVVSGEHDAIIPHDEIDLLEASIPGAVHRVVRHAGHMPMVERPERVSALLGQLAEGSSTFPEIPEPPPLDEAADTRWRE